MRLSSVIEAVKVCMGDHNGRKVLVRVVMNDNVLYNNMKYNECVQGH